MPSAQVWIENTTSKYEHGGPGWEFGTCIWSPATDRRGVEGKYKIMRLVQTGCPIINCYDNAIRGVSMADGDCFTTDNSPPNAGPWAYARNFHRINLRDYKAVAQPISLKSIVDEHKDDISREIETERPKYNLFSWWPPSDFYPSGRVVPSQGRFLASATPLLCKIICEMAGSDRSLFESVFNKSPQC